MIVEKWIGKVLEGGISISIEVLLGIFLQGLKEPTQNLITIIRYIGWESNLTPPEWELCATVDQRYIFRTEVYRTHHIGSKWQDFLIRANLITPPEWELCATVDQRYIFRTEVYRTHHIGSKWQDFLIISNLITAPVERGMRTIAAWAFNTNTERSLQAESIRGGLSVRLHASCLMPTDSEVLQVLNSPHRWAPPQQDINIVCIVYTKGIHLLLCAYPQT
jgi:hypothetical protein